MEQTMDVRKSILFASLASTSLFRHLSLQISSIFKSWRALTQVTIVTQVGESYSRFGYVTMAQVHQTRNEYRRTFVPVIFARIIEETEATTIIVSLLPHICCPKALQRER